MITMTLWFILLYTAAYNKLLRLVLPQGKEWFTKPLQLIEKREIGFKEK